MQGGIAFIILWIDVDTFWRQYFDVSCLDRSHGYEERISSWRILEIHIGPILEEMFHGFLILRTLDR